MNACVSAVALALFISAGVANGQLVVGNDQGAATNPTLWLIDVSGATGPRALASGTMVVGGASVNVGMAWGAAADEDGRVLYWNNGVNLFSAAYASVGMLAPEGKVITLAGTSSTTSVTGLAYDAVERRLYGFKSTTSIIDGVTYLAGIYEIDPATGQATLAQAAAGLDYGGFDYDRATDSFYVLNDSVNGLARGLLRISKPLSAGGAVMVAPYPAGETDIDGLAMGGGRAYLVNDIPAQGVLVYNLDSGAYEANIGAPFTANGIFSAGAWAPGLMTPPCGSSDFNGDGDFGTDADIEDFFACLAGVCCPTCFPSGADFNVDGDTGTDADIEAFFRVLGGGGC